MSKRLGVFVLLVGLATVVRHDAAAKTGTQGWSPQGWSPQGWSPQGWSPQGWSPQGWSPQGWSPQGWSPQGWSPQGWSPQGWSPQGWSPQGWSPQGSSLQGVDRSGGGQQLSFLGMSLAAAQVGGNMQGLQSGAPVPLQTLANPTVGLQLQLEPQDTSFGSYISAPALPNLSGSLWSLSVGDGTTTASIPVYVAALEGDTEKNQSIDPSNNDLFLYTVYYRAPDSGRWLSLCPLDLYGHAHAIAVPQVPSDRTSTSKTRIMFACTGTGVASKCARVWGYKPWKTVQSTVWNGTGFVDASVDLGPLYDACLIAARADYCQDDQSYTVNGTLVDLFDTLDGISSINPTAGLPYAPNASGFMLHDEYQISASNLFASPQVPYLVSPTSDQAAQLDPSALSLVSALRRSGMESSRYADLDPGRSCLAAPYIDRCTPKEPYDCYRSANMSTEPYGAFVAVNSPRHCSHDEETSGEPLDPICDECVNRVCQIDPTCCGDPGSTYYPGSLVWDERCSAIRWEVCKSSLTGAVWPKGQRAPPPSSHPTIFLNGAIGSFERVVAMGGTEYAEGWACDPDFPNASSPVQISVGGPLGAPGTVLYTSTADAVLIPGWRETVAAECGGGTRHGFSVAIAASAGKDVYAYGIDLNVPGAPFTLLRGGKKTVPGAAPPSPQAAIWTGWVSPTTSGSYTFAATVTTGDLYRLWVNGSYVAGNWVDTNSTAPGAFTLQPPSPPPSMYLQAGVLYGVRAEYVPAGPSSSFALQWSADSMTFASVRSANLYPMGQEAGNGLQGTYFSGALDVGAQPTQTYGAVDYIWTHANPPVSTLVVDNLFSARFQGQVMPPVSGDYSFSVDTDGGARIKVNGVLVADTANGPPGIDQATCPHDICKAGAAVSRACAQGYFCASYICQPGVDPACCGQTWDARCVREVTDICGLSCGPIPTPITLQAGVKYDITVEYQHIAGRGATLHLKWALAGGRNDVIPQERLFAASSPTISPSGVGLNAAYFLDSAFQTEYLDHVESTLAFQEATPPTPASATSMICGGQGAPDCGAAPPALGPPALASPSDGATIVGSSVTVSVGGIVRGATVSLFDNNPPNTLPVATVTAASDASDGGEVSLTLTNVAPGPHVFTAVQALGTNASLPSSPISLQVVSPPDPAAPPPPTVAQSAKGVVSNISSIQLSGTGTPGATVTVAGAPGSPTFTVDGTGGWGGVVTLPGPGDYTLTITEAVGAHMSAPASTVDVKVSLPALTLTSPANGDSFTGTVTVSGLGADPTLGPVVVADGDGKYFTDAASLSVAPNGIFNGSVSLDYGQHQLKVLQRSGGLDGPASIVTIQVTPPVGALAITDPSAGSGVAVNVSVKGTGAIPRSGLRGSIVVYESGTKVGTGAPGDDGTFSISVTLPSVGQQTLSVSQTAASLSGAGSAESAQTTPIPIIVIPPAPLVTTPLTGTSQASLTLQVAGSAVPGATVSLFVDGSSVPFATATAAADGSFSASPTLANGVHILTLSQTVDAFAGPSTTGIQVALGDTDAPTISAPSQLSISTSNAQGGVLDTSSITATDDGSSLPVVCVPPSGTLLPLGATNVTCEATDAVGNRATVTVVAIVNSTQGPVITVANAIAEAQGSSGAVVPYVVSATGSIADCSPPGSSTPRACTNWAPADSGLGFAPVAFAQDASDGTLYAVEAGQLDSSSVDTPPVGAASFLRLKRGESWERFALFPGYPRGEYMAPGQILVAGSSIYLASWPLFPAAPGPQFDGGLGVMISRDRGASWVTALQGWNINKVVADPVNPQHLYAWGSPKSDTSAKPNSVLYESVDAGNTWQHSALELPEGEAIDLALDPLNPGRMYLAVLNSSPPPVGGTIAVPQTILYRKVGAAVWERLSVPAYLSAEFTFPRAISVAPRLETNQNYPTIFAGTVISWDGGETWADAFPGSSVANCLGNVVFDPTDANTVLASSGLVDNSYGQFLKSTDGGRTWSGFGAATSVTNLIQDSRTPTTLYAHYRYSAADAFYTSIDGGQNWSPMTAPGLALGDQRVVDMAFDPVDPSHGYLASQAGGVFKTTDGGNSWTSANSGLDIFDAAAASHLSVDRFNRHYVYLTDPGLRTSLNGASNWTYITDIENIGSGNGPFPPLPCVGFDPVQSQQFYVYTFSIFEELIVSWSNGQVTGSGRNGDRGSIASCRLSVAPDRTVVLSTGPTPGIGGLTAIPSTQWQVLRLNAHGDEVALMDLSLPPGQRTGMFWDSSGGPTTLFMGGQVFGSGATNLFAAATNTLPIPGIFVAPAQNYLNDPIHWEQLGGGSGFSDFSTLLVDPASGGRVMYTVGIQRGLYESDDAGATWNLDGSAPPDVAQVWLSPADGAVFAVRDTSILTGPDLSTPFFPAGRLWKRSLATTIPTNARIVQGALRPTCQGADGIQSVLPGATFPIGDTNLTCGATDAFGNKTTQSHPFQGVGPTVGGAKNG